MALPENPQGPGGQPERDITRTLRQPEQQGAGLDRKYFKAGPVVKELSRLKEDEPWGEDGIDSLTLGVAETFGVGEYATSMDRLSYYATGAVGELLVDMVNSINRWEDGLSGEQKEVLDTNTEQLSEARDNIMRIEIEKNMHMFARPKSHGDWITDEELEDVGDDEEVQYYDQDQGVGYRSDKAEIAARQVWSQKDAQLKVGLANTRNTVRQLENDPKVAEARDFFELIGCTPEAAELLANNPNIVNDRRNVHYWATAAARGFNSIVEVFGQFTKAVSDLDSSMDLLTKAWNEKPSNTEIRGTLRSKTMDKAVSETFRILLDMDIVDVTYGHSGSGTDINGRPVTFDVASVTEPAYLAQFGLSRSAFNKDHTPEERQKFLMGLQRAVSSRLRESGVKRSNAWASQAAPLALALYEVMLLGSRAGVRRDKEGNPVKEVKMVEVAPGDRRVMVDSKKNVVYVSEKNGPATVTGWLNDLDEKAFRSRERVLGQGSAGFSAPNALTVFGTPERFARPMLEKSKIKVTVGGNQIEESMLDALRNGHATVGQCLANMSETSRGVEYLGLFRVVNAFNALSTVPFAKMDNILAERKADDRFIQDLIKYFSGLRKAIDFIYKGDIAKQNLIMVNTLSLIVRYGKRTDPAEGGNPQSNDEGFSFNAWFDSTWDALRTHLCYNRAEIDPDVFDLGVKLGRPLSRGAKHFDNASATSSRKVLANDRVGMLQFEDLVNNPALRTLLSKDPKNNPVSTFNMMAQNGPDGDSYDPKTQATARNNALNALLSESI